MTDADSPLDQTLMDRIRTNDQDHEDRINAFLVVNESAVNEDFTTSVVNPKFEHAAQGINGVGTFVADTHSITLGSTSSDIGGGTVHLLPTTFSVRMNVDQKIVFEAHIKYFTNGIDVSEHKFVMGFQDVAMTYNTAAAVTDVTDYVGWVAGGTDDTTLFYAEDAASGGQSGSDFGDVTAWQVFRVEVDATSAGTVWSARGYLDSVLKTTHTTEIPDAVHIRPIIGHVEFTGTSITSPALSIDYFKVWHSERPVMA